MTFLIFPVMAIGSLAFRVASRRRLPAHARDDRRDHRLPAGDAVGHPRRARVRAGAAPPRALRRAQRRSTARPTSSTVNLNAAYFPAVEFVSAVATVGILLSAAARRINGDIEIGVLVGFIAALNGFFDPIGQLSQVYTTYQSGMAALDKIFELLDEQPDADRRARTRRPAERIRGEIRFEDVSFRYRTADGRRSSRWRTSRWSCPPGQTVALVGATGAGKSTFAKLVARFYDPTDGPRARRRPRPARRGRAIAALADGDRAPGGVPVQRHASRDNIAFGRPDADGRRSIEAAARAVGAWDFIAALPDGLETEVGERGVQLSAGQRQLRGLRPRARSPTRGSSSSTRRPRTSTCTPRAASRPACGGCSPGRTAIVIAHRLSTIRQAGRIVVLDQRPDRRAGHATTS